MNRVLIQDRLTGCLFLLPLLAYGFGNAFFDAALNPGSATNPVLITAGTLLLLLNGITVLAIAVMLYPLLYRHSKAVAVAYLVARVMEVVLLLLGMIVLRAGIYMVSVPEHPLRNVIISVYQDCYQVAMLLLGAGSVAFCSLLYRRCLLPVAWSVWGIAGYGLLAAGAVLELCGIPLGLHASIPGGLFELALGIRLIACGWNRL